jgi:hypothetical protein
MTLPRVKRAKISHTHTQLLAKVRERERERETDDDKASSLVDVYTYKIITGAYK